MTIKELIRKLSLRHPDEIVVINPDSGGEVTIVEENGDDGAGAYTLLYGSYAGVLSPVGKTYSKPIPEFGDFEEEGQ